MDPRRASTFRDVQMSLTPLYIKTNQIFYLSLAGGVIIFLFVVVFMYEQSGELLLSANIEMVRLLSITHLLYAVAVYPLAFYLFERLFLGKSAQPGGELTAEKILTALRVASIVRLSIMEGIAFLGLVVCFIAAQGGVLRNFPEYWLNLLSSVVLLAYVVLDFPTKERLEATCRHRILHDST